MPSSAPDLDLGPLRAVPLADRALHLPALDMLVIADLHLGKGDVFRRAGLALPRGGTAGDLGRLDTLVAATAAGRLMILGDVLHGAANAAAWRAQWQAWREAHAALRIEAVVGNHDRALAQAGLGIVLLERVHREAGLVFRHDPQTDASAPVLAGHLHPVVRMHGVGPANRLPAFWLARARRVLTLPAFSAFTGGAEFRPAPDDAVLVCGGDAVVPLPARAVRPAAG
ncbi:ligase-associated DNA damage response endonuclease PdeM [Coralloluteibacterium stylophorae]|uniref:Ligase-associated DNA damage response endonuclease PdeM n=1 Tax=Coralloluteibacterium stylophorae TaxID=1776034 RepID=A0A8J7VV46_9GAMM|nr:ligase-associated DNA damage response endonuclease PdeM [Coralloluteibacterium stylophorae]MBS7458629.1 ligase-associated DNA damage response endonuclease PdeM [Coralloluteibacterium stylophorae]